jgi:uncharacterized membrane protein YhaH (DUF805 family)
MGIQEAVLSCISQYVGFEGRATRPECWWWACFVLAGWVILWALGGAFFGTDSGAGPVSGGFFGLAAFLPGLAVSARRLHDTDRNGWWLLLLLVPVAGSLVLVWLMTQPGTPGPNKYGNGLPILGLA